MGADGAPGARRRRATPGSTCRSKKTPRSPVTKSRGRVDQPARRRERGRRFPGRQGAALLLDGETWLDVAPPPRESRTAGWSLGATVLPTVDATLTVASRMTDAPTRRGWEFQLEQRRPLLRICGPEESQELVIQTRDAVALRKWQQVSVVVSVDGDRAAVRMYIDGQPRETTVERIGRERTCGRRIPRRWRRRCGRRSRAHRPLRRRPSVSRRDRRSVDVRSQRDARRGRGARRRRSAGGLAGGPLCATHAGTVARRATSLPVGKRPAIPGPGNAMAGLDRGARTVAAHASHVDGDARIAAAASDVRAHARPF